MLTFEDEFAMVRDYYWRRLHAPAVLPDYEFPPVKIGPTWQVTEDGYWLLPKLSLGWDMLAWTGVYLQSDGEPWKWTDEQARFLVWWYSVDEGGRFRFRDGVLQRLKGFGKDPIGAGIGLFEMLGPCRFDGWGDDGQPVGKSHPEAWVQVAAVSLEQTKNTMKLLPHMATARLVQDYGLSVGKVAAYAGDNQAFQAVTSSPATLQGARATFTLLNETHEWVKANSGHDMELVLQNNATKSKGGMSRTLRITNAYEPGQDSVAEHDREAYEKMLAGKIPDTGIMYDSLEAHPEAPLTLEAAPEVVRSVRGDSVWLDVETIVKRIGDPRSPASALRRFWYNQIVAAEDAWITPQQAQAAVDDDLVLMPDDEVFLFGDGSKSDDASGLVACRLSDGAVFTLHVDQPEGGRLVDREAFDHAVREAFDTYRVLAFWFDPSHAKDKNASGEDDSYWRPTCDRWMRDSGRKLRMWAANSGEGKHAVIFDMAKPSVHQVFVQAAEQALADFEQGTLRVAPSAAMQTHLKNARRSPGRYGVSVRKEHRESARKSDLAVCLIGARAMWRKWLNDQVSGSSRTPGRGRVIVLD